MMSERDDSSHFASLHYVDQNCNYLQENRNYAVTDKPGYARPSHYRMSPDDRKGNCGSRGFILGCRNRERDLNYPPMLEKDKIPDTQHYTMAWIQEQNK